MFTITKENAMTPATCDGAPSRASVPEQTITRGAARSQLGMTLLEIMIVLAIIAAVMGILVGPKVLGMFSDSKVTNTKIQVNKLATGDFGLWSIKNPDTSCPGSLTEIDKKTTDSWGQELIMVCGEGLPEGVPFGVYSKGPDKKAETKDDIKSWDDGKSKK